MYLRPFLADKGFTGKLSAKYISQNCPTSLIWAVAGCSQPKLTAVVTNIKALNTNRKDPDVIIADSNDFEALVSLAQSTRVVLSVAGPFAMYQEPPGPEGSEECVRNVNLNGQWPSASVQRELLWAGKFRGFQFC
jgi:hypothetical protein